MLISRSYSFEICPNKSSIEKVCKKWTTNEISIQNINPKMWVTKNVRTKVGTCVERRIKNCIWN